MTGLICDNTTMDGSIGIERLQRRLSAILDQQGVKPTTLSLKIGNSPTLVSDLLGKTADVKLSTLQRLAEALNVSVGDLIADDFEPMPNGPRLFVKGEVSAGTWAEAYEWPQDEWRGAMGRADIDIPVVHRFFLRVQGDSMDLVYPEGSLIECVSIFSEPAVLPGRRVVVVRTRDDGMMEATVKEVAEVNDEIWFTPKSSNPSHQAFKASDCGEEVAEVSIVALVVASVRPE